MGLSFEEKSVWVQLIAVVVGLGVYFAVAGVMAAQGVTGLIPYAPVLGVAVVLLVLVMVAGHIVAAVSGVSGGVSGGIAGGGGVEPADERDRLIGWRAGSRTGWILAAGIVLAIGCMLVGVGAVWVAHLLLGSLFLAEVVKLILQLTYYRRGV